MSRPSKELRATAIWCWAVVGVLIAAFSFQVLAQEASSGVQGNLDGTLNLASLGSFQHEKSDDPSLRGLAKKKKKQCAENGSCYGDISEVTGRPKTVYIPAYVRGNGARVKSHYRSPTTSSSDEEGHGRKPKPAPKKGPSDSRQK